MHNDILMELLPAKQLENLKKREESKQVHFELLMELEELKEKGEVIDKFPCHRLFLKNFIREDMNESFKQIAQRFVRKHADKLNTYHTVQYVSESATECKPDELLKNRILNCMMTAAINGDSCVKNDFIQLYKKYYKSEYNQLKRFRIISEKDAIVLAGIEKDGMEISIIISRLLSMTEFMNIEHKESVNKLYLLMHKATEVAENEESPIKTYEKYSTLPEQIKECYLEIREMEDEVISANEEIPLYTFGINTEFQNLVLNQNGFNDDYILNQVLESENLDDVFANTLHLMKQVGNGKQFTYPEVQQLASIYTSTTAYCKNMRQIASDIDAYLGFNTESEDVNAEPATSKIPSKTPSVSTTLSSDERKLLEDQIKQLQQELHQKEMKEKNTYALYQEQKQRALQAEAQLAVYEHDRAELISLREHVYQMTEGDTAQEDFVSIDEMVTKLKDANIAIIGGHINWINKMKSLFPNFKYIRTKETSAVSDSIMDNVSKAYFFTDTISHVSYNRFVTLAIKRNIPFGYMHGVNMEKTIRQMYEDLNHGK